ncbi:MAG: peptide-methionine (S)-S-oxide reductase MsrA [Pseudomonadota bacterium]
MLDLRIMKLVVLSAAIATGLFFQSQQAHAGETEVLTLAGGCFWCVESDFEKVDGVNEVISGYTGGAAKNPTYKDVVKGGTGHYEAVQIFFDPEVVSRDALLHMFFRSVDPTDAGGQFCDRGQSYSTAIFTSNDAQKSAAKKAKSEAARELGQEIVTPIIPAGEFYRAEDYHQDYAKGTNLVITRFGVKRQSDAYKAYRNSCGRDVRVKQLWGDKAPFAGT